MKSTILLSLLLLVTLAFSQDTVINNGVYKVHYNLKYRVPTKIEYHLYKGGGECSREKMTFRSQPFTSNNNEYKKSGYDRGHMANAEDFAFDCAKMNKTFEFYNVVPQTHHLNAGIFKHYETTTRDLSQTDSISVTLVNVIDKKNHIGTNTYKVISTYRIVRSLTTGAVLICVRFSYLTESAVEIHINQAQSELGMKL